MDNIPISKKITFVKKLNNDKLFNICLVHQTAIWHTIRDDVEIMFSGHTHNGQIFPFSHFVKSKFKYIFEVYKHTNNRLVVSFGAGTWGPKMCLDSYNEVTELTIEKAGPNP